MLEPAKNENLFTEQIDPQISLDNNDPTDPPNGDDEKDPIIVSPIISANKIQSYIADLERKGIKWEGKRTPQQYSNSITAFREDLGFSYIYSNKPVPTKEEGDSIYDSFRDLEAEEQKREQLRAKHITQQLSEEQLKNSELSSVEVIDDADATLGEDVKTAYKTVPATNEDVKETIKSYTKSSGGMDVKFDMQIATRNLETRGAEIGEGMGVQAFDYNYLDYDGERLRLYNDNDVYQNIYRGNRYKAFQNLDTYNYDFDIDGTFGQMIESLDFNFLLQDANGAANMFNNKFSKYGITAKPVIESGALDTARPKHFVEIYGQDGKLLIPRQRLFGGETFGISKEALIDFFGTPDVEDPGALLKTIIRPQVYTQEFANFQTKFKVAAQNISPAANFASGWGSAENKIFYTINEFEELSDIGVASSDVIVNLLNESGVESTINDAYRNFYSNEGTRYFKSKNLSGLITVAREKLRNAPERPGREIRLADVNIQLDKDGFLGQLQYEYDLGVNTSEALRTILNESTNPYDIIIDRYGNKATVKDIMLKSFDHYSNMIRRNIDNTSRNIGLGLIPNGAFRDIPLEGLESQLFVVQLQQKGFNFFNHMPTDGITIDGIPGTYEQIFNIVTDPSMNNKARRGEIEIVLGNPEDYGFMGQSIEAAAALMDRNNTNFDGILGYRNEFTNTADQTYEWFEDLFQSVGIEFLNAGASLREINKDLLIGFGMSEETADFVTKGPFVLSALPGGGSYIAQPGRMFTKEYVNDLREEFLPLWTTKITEAKGDDAWATAGEFFMLANQPLGQSLPYMAAIMVNPVFGVSTIGVNSYGETLYNYKSERERLQKAYDAGVPLTEVEMNLMDMSNNDIRLLAGVNGITEAGITALFTVRYLHGRKVWGNLMKGKKPPSPKQLDKIAHDMAFRFDSGFNAAFNRLMGIEGRALVYENVEESSITFMKYLYETTAGLREFDFNEMRGLLKETMYHASFSSLGLSAAMRYKGNNNLNNISEIVMAENLGTSNLYKQTDLKINVSEALSKFTERLKSQGYKDKTIQKEPFYKWATEFLKTTQANINEILESRTRLVKSLEPAQKVRFMTVLAEIENSNAILENFGQNSQVRVDALAKIKSLKAELGDIIGTTGNPDAFQFLPFDMQSSYLSQAFSEINFDEMKEKDPNFTEKMWEEAVEKKAIELYVTDAKIANANFVTEGDTVGGIDIAAAFGNTDVNTIIQTSIDPKFLANFDLNEQLDLAAQKILDSYGVTETVNKDMEGNVIAEVKTDGTVIEDGKVVDENNIEENNLTEEQQRIKNLRAKVNGLIERIRGYKSSQNNEFLESLDLDLNSDDFSKLRGTYIMKFFETLNNSNNFSDLKQEDFQFQRLESILDAHDIAVEIATDIKEGSIEPFKGNKFLNRILKLYSGDYGVTFNKSIATLDVLKNLVIRNENAAVPFLTLYEEINRKVNVVDRNANLSYENLFKIYTDARNKDKNFFTKTKFKGVEINDEYQMSLLAGLRRINLDADDVNSEFSRYKKNVFEELALRKKEMEMERHPRYTTAERKKRYELLLNAINDLDLENAQNYEDVKSKARAYNVDVVENISNLFAEGESDAKARVYGFGQNWTNFQNYTPMFLTPQDKMTAEQINNLQYEDSTILSGGINTSGALQYATTPDSYIKGTNFRLQFGGFLRNASNSLKGSRMDATVRKDMQTMVELFSNPIFKKLFKNENDYHILKGLFATEMNNRFNYKVNEGKSAYTDYGDVKSIKFDGVSSIKPTAEALFEYGSKTLNTMYGLGSAVSLASLTQPVQQFYSALFNHGIRANNQAVRNFYAGKIGQFTIGVAGTANGNKRNTLIGQFIQEIFGQGDKSNIYALSQVSLRNSLKAELPLQDNSKLDISYYEKSFGLDAGFLGKYGLSGKYTFDQIIDRIQTNSELSLNFFLARTDKIAANAAFEGHYLDYKINNGSKYPSDSKGRLEWWANENKNPDIDAINYADSVVKEVMRPSSSLSEAQIYNTKHKGFQAGIQVLYPFAKFSVNAKTQFWSQYSLANDESLPADQRAKARRTMQGILAEMAVFQSSKTVAQAAIYGTLGQVLFGFDDDEVERGGGLQAIINEIILPLDDRKYMQKVKKWYKTFNDKEDGIYSLEALNAYYQMHAEHRLGPDVVATFEDLQKYGNTYGNKSDLSPKNNNVFQMIVGDVIKTLDPLPVPDAAHTFLYSVINYQAQKMGLANDKIFLEFASEDFDRNKDGYVDEYGNIAFEFISENLGLMGVTVQQAKKIEEALDLMKRNEITKRTPTGAMQTQYVGTGNKILNEKLDTAIGTVFLLRMISALGMAPGAPNAELNKIADKLYRGMERYINETESAEGKTPQSTPDPNMKTSDKLRYMYMNRYFETLEQQQQERFEEPLPDNIPD